MPLAAGVRLGPYEIVAPLGRGGMGEVYKARDTRLGRTVAVKVISSARAMAPEVRERFTREARTIASLNHPKICAIHDIGSATLPGDGEAVDYLVMEHLEGVTLAHRLQRGGGNAAARPLNVDDAVSVAIAIAQALGAAHAAGIVHRDLKPSNVMLTPSGVKLLDFGVAKWERGPMAAVGAAATAPTETAVTSTGVVIGTLGYMSPEQARGEMVDARADLFAFGCVLYEMLSGRRPFAAGTTSDVLAAVLRDDPPPLSSERVPPSLDRILRHCLEKDRAKRFQSACDIVFALESLDLRPPLGPSNRAALGWATLPWLLLAVVAAVAAILYALTPRAPAFPPHFSLAMADNSGLRSPTDVAIAPDGRSVVFRTSDGRRSRLYLRRFAASRAEPLEGTDGALGACFSPDSGSIAFMSATGLFRLDLDGTPPVLIMKDLFMFNTGMEWGEDGRIVFSRGGRAPGLWSVDASARSTTPTRLIPAEESAGWYLKPRRVPGTSALLFSATRQREWNTRILALRDGKVVPILDSGLCPRYLPQAGVLVFQDQGRLLGVPFDPATLKTTGTPRTLLADVGNSEPWMGEYDVSADGTLVYLAPRSGSLVWKTRSGETIPLGLSIPGSIEFVTIAPDQKHATVSVRQGSAYRLYRARLEGSVGFTPWLERGDAWFGLYTPDGQRLLFTSSIDDGAYNVYSLRTDGSGPPVRQTRSVNQQDASSFCRTHEGDMLLISEVIISDGTTGVYQQRLDHPETVKPLVDTRASELEAAFSPDCRWVAYESNSGGQFGIYVQRYPTGAPSVVSPEGGQRPVWNPAGGEVFYQQFSEVYAVGVQNGERQGSAVPLFERPETRDRNWDVGDHGRRFLVGETVRAPYINVVAHWFEELKTKMARQ